MESHEHEHLYVHVPFCDGKCLYCAFYSEIYTPERAAAYLDSLGREFDLYLKTHPRPAPKTIYFGGGTSSILDSVLLERLCRLVAGRISLDQMQEWTIEANPGTLSDDKIRVINEYGITRVSMGAQSFDDAALERIGRRHHAEDVDKTVKALRAAGVHSVGLDLIACLPGVYDQAWSEAVQRAIALGPTHVSVYALTIERGTPLNRMVRSGDIIVPDEDLQLKTLDMAEELLMAAGYEHYEISNYAKPGFECAHNVSCWHGEDYLGLGPAASSRAGRKRWTNLPNIDLYVRALSVGEEPPRQEETLSPETDATERLIFGFRLSEGVDLKNFGSFSPTLLEHWQKSLTSMSSDGLVERRGDRWALSRTGRSLADFVAYELINL